MSKLYEVTSVRERRRFAPGGAEIDVIEIHLTTTHGATGTVTLTADEYNKEAVAEALESKAADLELPFGL